MFLGGYRKTEDASVSKKVKNILHPEDRVENSVQFNVGSGKREGASELRNCRTVKGTASWKRLSGLGERIRRRTVFWQEV